MTQQFYEGQEVEVLERIRQYAAPGYNQRRKAKIVAQYAARTAKATSLYPRWHVQFPDGTRAVFAAEHIRAVRGKFDEWPSPPASTATTEWSP